MIKLHANFIADNNHATWLYQTPGKENLNPNEVYSYESETEVNQEDAESEETMTAQYNCSVVANNHLYVGNIKQNGLIMSDTMIKSPKNKPGILPSSNKITVVSNREIDKIYLSHRVLSVSISWSHHEQRSLVRCFRQRKLHSQ